MRRRQKNLTISESRGRMRGLGLGPLYRAMKYYCAQGAFYYMLEDRVFPLMDMEMDEMLKGDNAIAPDEN